MKKIGDKIVQLDKPNGTFIVFGDYDSGDVFDDFLRYVNQCLGAEVSGVRQLPYSYSAKICFSFGEATALCQDGIGCAIRIDPGEDAVVKGIVEQINNKR